MNEFTTCATGYNPLAKLSLLLKGYTLSTENRWALVSTCRGFYELLSHLLYRQVELYIPLEYPKDRFSLFFRAVNIANKIRETQNITFFLLCSLSVFQTLD